MSPETAKNYEGLLKHLRAKLESEAFLKRHRRQEKDFTRKRCLSFVCVVLMLVNMMKRALQDELDEFFKLFHQEKVASRHVSKSAFSQARKKLKASAFVELNQEQVGYFYAHFAPTRWQGYRLTAIDGTLLDVPNNSATRAEFGVWGSRHKGEGTPKARVSQLFDVLNQVTIDGQIANKGLGERALGYRHLSHLGADDLLLLDRGYPAFWFFAAIRQRQAHFCARLDGTQWKLVKAFVETGADEQLIELTPSTTALKTCKAKNLPTNPLPLRLVRVDLPSGEVEVLLTSLLDAQTFPTACFHSLYHLRWPVEEDYKCVQSRFEIENWSGKSPESVYQDFHATLFTKNLAAILAQPAQAAVSQLHDARQHDYKVNMTNLISKLKDTILHLFWDASLLPLLQALWQQMIRTIEPIRPNRTYPRKKRVKRKRFPTTYKPTR